MEQPSNPCVTIERVLTYEKDGTPLEFTHKIYVYDLANKCQLGNPIGSHTVESTARACATRWADYYGMPVVPFMLLGASYYDNEQTA